MKHLLVPFLLLAASARATTLLVPADRDLIAGAKAIVIATAGQSVGRRAPEPDRLRTGPTWLETVTTLRVDEAIKGPIAAGDTIRVVELGGVVGSTHYAVAGSPTYAPGERVLLFLDTNRRGEWVSKAMAVGKFSVRGDLLVRAPLCGWNYDGTPHAEPTRAREPFLQFVRDVVRGAPAKEDYVVSAVRAAEVKGEEVKASSFALQWNGAQGNLGMRWNSFPSPVVFLSHGTQPNATNGGLTAAQRGLAAWTNDGGSNIVYTYGGTTPATSSGLDSTTSDGVNSILFNDPSNEIAGSFNGKSGDVLAVGGGWFDDATPANTHLFAGERFYTLFEADVVVQDGLFGSGMTGNGFDHVLTHELGHTLGLRHSDEPPSGGTVTSSAIMASSVSFNADPYGSTLQQWDRDAVAALYGAAIAPCKAPQITAEPQSATLGSAPATLTVTATGDAPLHYQWYTGARGNVTSPISTGTGASIAVQPATTTVYWARVSNGCDPAADSAAATVTVNGCPAVIVDSISPNSDIVQGMTVRLTATATGATAFQWYSGISGTTTAPLAGLTAASIDVTPAASTSYWVRASNGCGAFSDSPTVFVSVTPCARPAVAVQPASTSAVAGHSVTLYAGIDGSQPMTFVWYEGRAGDTSHPASNGNASQFVTPPLFAPAAYWLRATNLCGTVDTAAAGVDVVAACTAPAITAPLRDVAVVAGTSATLSVGATGTSLSYQWYQGPVLDFTRPVGGSAPTFVTPPISAATQYWVRVTNACGSANSTAAAVSIAAPAKRRAAGR